MRSKEPRGRMIDLRGLCSPQPVLVLADKAERVGPGETIGILSDDPYSEADFLDWCASARMDVVERKCEAGGVARLVFRRPPVASDPYAGRKPQTAREWGHAA